MAATGHAGPSASVAGAGSSETDATPQLAGSPDAAAPGAGAPPAMTAEWLDVLHRLHHDLRTPLNAVIGFSDMMQREMLGPLGHRRYREYAGHIRESGDRLLRAAEETLAVTALLANAGSQPRQPVCLRTCFETAWQKATAAGGVRLVISLDYGERVHAAPRILEQALQFLLRQLAGALLPSGPTLTGAPTFAGATVSVSIARRPDATELTIVAPSMGSGADRDRALALAALLIEFDGHRFTVEQNTGTGFSARIVFSQPGQSDLFR